MSYVKELVLELGVTDVAFQVKGSDNCEYIVHLSFQASPRLASIIIGIVMPLPVVEQSSTMRCPATQTLHD